MTYILFVTLRSGRELVSEPITVAEGIRNDAKQRSAHHNVTVAHALAVLIHDVLGKAVQNEELITLGPCHAMVGVVAVSGREVESLSVEVQQ